MRQPTPLRPDYDAALLREAARESKYPGQVHRLLTLAMIYEGASRTHSTKAGGVTVQVVRDWVLRFNAEGPVGLIGHKPPGRCLAQIHQQAEPHDQRPDGGGVNMWVKG